MIEKSWWKPHDRLRMRAGCCRDCGQPRGAKGTGERCRSCARHYNSLQRAAYARRQLQPAKSMALPVSFDEFCFDQRLRVSSRLEEVWARVQQERQDGMDHTHICTETTIERRG